MYGGVILKCGLCFDEITDEQLNDCRAADLNYKGGTYFHNWCWDGMIRYAKYRGWIE